LHFGSVSWRNAALFDRSGSYGYLPSSRLAFHQNTHPKTLKNLNYSVFDLQVIFQEWNIAPLSQAFFGNRCTHNGAAAGAVVQQGVESSACRLSYRRGISVESYPGCRAGEACPRLLSSRPVAENYPPLLPRWSKTFTL